ncbi:MAG TPA: lipocalin-like domain-containing protein [Gammaproteobacteria bacterium]
MSSGIRSALAALAALAALGGCTDPPADSATATQTLTGIRFLTTASPRGFSRATEARTFSFPADHGAHAGYRTEWWYFTGNLTGSSGNAYGFELTFFKFALPVDGTPRESRFATDAIWMAHFALTDIAAASFVADERLSRGTHGLAGAMLEPFRIWVEDWSADGDFGPAARMRLRAASSGAAIDLELAGFERIVLQGERGLDQKGPELGNASYYYSAPRLGVTGTVSSGDRTRDAVTGTAWMDREWGTSALPEGVVGWDWFGLRLDDGRDLMFYRLRRADGSASSFSGGSLTDSAGEVRRLDAEDVALATTDLWRSPASGATYPVAWRMTVPREGLDLAITPSLRDQELRLSARYWEGAVEVTGRAAAAAIHGHGYLELAGY